MSTLEKMPGGSRGLVVANLALLGADHLLLVRRSGYRERYRRIELVDIEAWAVEPTDSARRTTIALGVVLLATAFFAAISGGGMRILWGVPVVALAAALAIHLLHGPSCRVHLRTPLDWIEMPAWRRLPAAQKALERLSARVEAVQGELSHVEARRRLAEVSPPLLAPAEERAADVRLRAEAAAPAASEPVADARPASFSSGTVWHRRLLGLLCGDLALSVARALAPSSTLDLIAALYLLLELAVAVAALVVQERAGVARRLRRWTVTAMIGLSASFAVAAYVAAFASAFTGNATSPWATVAEVPDAVRFWMAIGSASVAGALLIARLAAAAPRVGAATERE